MDFDLDDLTEIFDFDSDGRRKDARAQRRTARKDARTRRRTGHRRWYAPWTRYPRPYDTPSNNR